MLNMLSSTVSNRISISTLKPGDIVNALGQIGVVRDVLRSHHTDNMCIYISFAHNLGNARQYDMLEVSPNNWRGVDKWCYATRQELETALERKRLKFNETATQLLDLA